MADSSKRGIFSGLRILDLTQYIAGPLACKLMSDLGTEVIKIELAPRGDMMRCYGPPEGQCTVFLDENRGRRSVGFDLKRPEGAELMRDLVPRRRYPRREFTSSIWPVSAAASS